MNWQLLWDYFGNFNDGEAFRIATILLFMFGIPVVIGLLAKTIAWSAKHVALCYEEVRR